MKRSDACRKHARRMKKDSRSMRSCNKTSPIATHCVAGGMLCKVVAFYGSGIRSFQHKIQRGPSDSIMCILILCLMIGVTSVGGVREAGRGWKPELNAAEALATRAASVHQAAGIKKRVAGPRKQTASANNAIVGDKSSSSSSSAVTGGVAGTRIGLIGSARGSKPKTMKKKAGQPIDVHLSEATKRSSLDADGSSSAKSAKRARTLRERTRTSLPGDYLEPHVDALATSPVPGERHPLLTGAIHVLNVPQRLHQLLL